MCGDTMSKIEVLSGSDLQDIEQWEHLLEEIPHADVYFLPQYAGIYERKGDGTSHCFVYQSDDGIVLYSFCCVASMIYVYFKILMSVMTLQPLMVMEGQFIFLPMNLPYIDLSKIF